MTGPNKAKLGFWALLALVVGNMIGSGIYLLPATLAPLGWNQAAGWIVTLGGALCLAAVFAGLAARVPRAGGPYAYADAAFGPVTGYTAAWAYWVMTWVGNGAIAIAVVSNLSLIFPVIGTIAGLPALLAIAFVWLLTLVNLRGVREAGQVQTVTTVLKVLPLIALIILALWFVLSGAPRAPDPGIALSGSTIATAAGLTFWGFLGLESATVPADKVENAARNVPRATMIGVVLTGLVYLGISLAFALYMPVDEAARSPAPVADFLGKTFGAGVAVVVALFAAISAFGALNGWILVQGEMPWAMARGGVFPRWFAKENANGTPVRGHLVSSVLLTGMILINSQKGMGKLFEFIGSVSIAAGLVAYLLSALAAIRLVGDDRRLTAAALVAAAFTLWAEWGLGWQANLYGGALILAGLTLYPLVRTAGSSGSAAGQPG
ncbi:amino acid permease [Novosphingobium sp.]|uniref:amino acid permease n=1 Tax=Novosphingobium sp. TaxID=1874826 RepID=UPI0025D62B06|nr:amino acid permease [Novosphingobium sp.]